MNQDYKERYLCYIDILGFSNAILSPDSSLFIRSIGFFKSAIDILQKIPERDDLLLYDLHTTQFSDCVAFSCNCNIASLYIFFNRISNLQQELLKGGLPSRGAVVKGNLLHDKKYIFGPALIEAVDLEEKYAKYPRVILSYDILQDINYESDIQFDHIICKDEDGCYYVQSVENWHQSDLCGLNLLRETILHGLRSQSVADKYRWLAKKFNARLEYMDVAGVRKIIL